MFTKNRNKKLIIFDLDGVILDSKKNMQNSWSKVCKKHRLNISFKKYEQYIGLPFFEILKKLKIKKEQFELIKKDYFNYSNLYFRKKINFFPKILGVIKKLKKNYKIAIFTSKNLTNTRLILKKINFKFDYLVAGSMVKNGKPAPEGILKILKKLKIIKKNTFYVGDTTFDYKSAKNAKVNYVHVDWGFEKLDIKRVKKIRKVSELSDFF